MKKIIVVIAVLFAFVNAKAEKVIFKSLQQRTFISLDNGKVFVEREKPNVVKFINIEGGIYISTNSGKSFKLEPTIIKQNYDCKKVGLDKLLKKLGLSFEELNLITQENNILKYNYCRKDKYTHYLGTIIVH